MQKSPQTAPKSEVVASIHASLAWLIERQPRLEGFITILEEFLANPESRRGSNLDYREVFKIYQTMASNHQHSLELLRKILIYFPVEHTTEEKRILAIYSKLDDAQRRDLREFLTALTNTTQSDSDSHVSPGG